MKTISIDIETFSSVDLKKSGVYRYCESHDFEILLFAYSVDGGAVEVINLANGETIPQEIIDALIDDNVEKWAFNANFERVCLSRYLRDQGLSLDPFADNHHSAEILGLAQFLNPESWRCSMVWAAYMGLPLSLEAVGEVLKLENQKLKEGRDLIRLFCQPCSPTKANGSRTRNLPTHLHDKWERFVEYNRRDVETEMEIQQKLAKFPVPNFIWDEYKLDQEINDRGIRLDMPLVKNAITADARSWQSLFQRMQEITELANPNSVSQLKEWLASQGIKVTSLGKKDAATLVKDAPPLVAEALELRLQLAKSSVKKYQAMEASVCLDNRVRGLFQYYGANGAVVFNWRP